MWSFPIGNAQNVLFKCNILTTPFRTWYTLRFPVPPMPWLPDSGLPYLSGKSVHLESGVSWGHLPFGMLKTFCLSVTTWPHHFILGILWVTPSHPWPSRQWSFIVQWWVCPFGVWISMGTSSIWDVQNFFFKRDNLTWFLNTIKTVFCYSDFQPDPLSFLSDC